MRTMRVGVLLLAAMNLLPSRARGDIAPPAPEPKNVPVRVYLDEKAKESRIQVPQSLTAVRVRPRPGGAPPTAIPLQPLPKAPITGGGESPKPEKPASNEGDATDLGDWEADADQAIEPAGTNQTQLMVAGMALTMSLGCGGVWLLRRPNTSSLNGVVVLIASGVVLAASTLVWANVPVPQRPPADPKIDLPLLSEGKFKLEILPRGETINIILDKETHAKLTKKD